MAGKIVVAKATIRGTKPLMWHHFGRNAIPLERQVQTGVAGNDPEEWKRTYLATKDGQLYLPDSYIFGCMRDGARHVKKGRGSMQPALVACLEIVESRVLVDRFLPADRTTLTDDPEQPVYIDIRSVVNPGTDKRNIRYRVTVSPGWTATFHLRFDSTVVNAPLMHSVLIEAGRLVGIGNGRVTKRGGISMGRFEVESFEVEQI